MIDHERLREYRLFLSRWLTMHESEKRCQKQKVIKDDTYKAFCDYLFFDNTQSIYLSLRPYIKSYYNWNDDNNLSLFLSGNESLTFGKPISNKHIVVDPELLEIYTKKYGDFIHNVFDIDSCVFCYNKSYNSLKHYKSYDYDIPYFTCRYYNTHCLEYLSNEIRHERINEKCSCGLPIDIISLPTSHKKIIIRNNVVVDYDKEHRELDEYFSLYSLYIGYTKYKLIYNICVEKEKEGCERYMMDKRKMMLNLYDLSVEFKFCLPPTEINYFKEI